MAASFTQDVARLEGVLRANAVEKQVDKDILVALLELYAADEQRVDLVLLDLQGMLGKELSLGAQQERWNDFQQGIGGVHDEGINIEYENLNREAMLAGSHNDVMVLMPDNTVLNRNNKFKPSQGSPNKRRRIGDLGLPVPHLHSVQIIAQPVPNQSQAPASNNPNTVASTGAAYPQQSALPVASTSASTLPKALVADAVKTENRANASTSGAGPSTALARESNELSSTKEDREQLAVQLHKSLIAVAPFLHVKYAAFKAAEFATLKNSALHMEDFTTKIVLGSDARAVKAGQVWDPPETENAEQQRLFHHVYDDFISSQVDFLVRTLPDADPEYLEEMVRNSNGDQNRVRDLHMQLLEGQLTCPTRADYNKRKKYNELANKFFTAEEFLELYDDPFKHFSDETRVTDRDYQEEALNQLKMDFRFTGVASIRRVFSKHKYHYFPAYQELDQAQFAHERKTKRGLNECLCVKTKDIFLIQEVAFARVQKEIQNYEKNKEQMRLEAVEAARNLNALLDCPICCEDELVELDLIKCPMGHAVCRNCVRRQSEEQIGLMKNHVRCLSPDCPTEYNLQALKEVLGKSTYKRLEKRLQAEEILAAGIEGLESCPFCDYSEVPRDTDKLFQCKAPDCGRVSCRQCREDNHLPLRCDEHAMKQRLTNYVEAKMTDALLRECPACKRKFIKSDGCNKMVCPCGVLMCYVCRKQIRGYDHFANAQPGPTATNQYVPASKDKCPLYSDTKKLHEEEVASSAARARAELASRNPNIRVDLVLGKK